MTTAYRYPWNDSMYNNTISEDFIRKFHNTSTNWFLISRYCQLSEEFIREFELEVYWFNIFIYQNHLSNNFKREFQHRINWDTISLNHDLTKKFIIEFANELKIKLVLDHQPLDPETREYLLLLKG